MNLNVENYGTAKRDYGVYTVLSSILKIHEIAPEYKFFRFPRIAPQYSICHAITRLYSIITITG